MSEIERIAKLLKAPAPETRVAAAVVLGELRTKNAKAVRALAEMASRGEAALQVAALEALEKIAPKRALSRLLPLLSAGPTEVRRAAGRAIAALGPAVVKQLKVRLPEAGAAERRVVHEVLADVGGRDAFSTLLNSLITDDAELGRQAALAVRQRIKEAPTRERGSYLTQAKSFLTKQKAAQSGAAVAGAVKILGFLETPQAIPLLLTYARNKKQPTSIRQEALIGLRFAVGPTAKKTDRSKVVAPLLDILEKDMGALARAARDTLMFVPLPPSAVPRLKKLAMHKDLDRARFAIHSLGGIGSREAWNAVAAVLLKADPTNAQIAAEVLAKSPDAGSALTTALISAGEAERAWVIARVLERHAKKLDTRTRGRLLKAAMERLAKGEEAWEAPLKIARIGDAEKAAKALRGLADKLRRSTNKEKAIRVFRLLARSRYADDDDRYVLASLELRDSPKDMRLSSRTRDPALKRIAELLNAGFDVAAAMRRDRALTLEEKYYAGFHFIEQDHPLGLDLLEEVVKKGGRKKIARAAKNKLKLQK